MRLSKLHQYKDVYAVVAVLAAFVLVLLYSTRMLYFRLDTDYNVAIPMAQFARLGIMKPTSFLTWNPYIGLGRPVLGDPSSLLFSPWFMPFFLVFGAVNGLRINIAFTIICSGITMWFLLRAFVKDRHISQWGALLYSTSGAIAAMIASGHIEKFPTYACAPIVFYILLKRQYTLQRSMILGLIYAVLFFSVDFYGIWFFSLFWIVFSLYDIVKKYKTIGMVLHEGFIIYGMFAIYASAKLIPFIRDVLPHFSRGASFNPFMGSIHFWLLPLPYIIPWQVLFYDRPTLQRLLQFRYNWYEYYAFITPFAVIPLLYIRRVMQQRIVAYAIISILLGACYISLQYVYSPFYWIVHVLPIAGWFRVPQRIVVPLLVPLVLLISLCFEALLKEYGLRRRIIFLGIGVTSLLWTFVMSYHTMKTAFVPNRNIEELVVQELRSKDAGTYYVATFACCLQPYLFDQSIPVLNYYYGWTPVGHPTFKTISGDANDYSAFTYIKPTYIIANGTDDFSVYGYTQYIAKQNIRVWKTDHPTILPTL